MLALGAGRCTPLGREDRLGPFFVFVRCEGGIAQLLATDVARVDHAGIPQLAPGIDVDGGSL